jgi:RHS repeat-associated protein
LASTQLPTAVSNAVYNANNQLTQWGSTAITYDKNGNTLNDGTNSYVWDARNRLASANSNADMFAYDPLGRRIKKTILSTTTNFLYDGVNAVQESGTLPTANLLTGGIDERFQRTSSTETDDYLTDALGSTIELTGQTGASQVQYSYGPYGSQSASGATTTNSYAYTGREFDGLGIDYYRARYYNPTTGRFLSEDPIGLRGGTNLYAYAGNNPISFRDSFGLKPHDPNNNNCGGGSGEGGNGSGGSGGGSGDGSGGGNGGGGTSPGHLLFNGLMDTGLGLVTVGASVGGEIGTGGLATPLAIYGAYNGTLGTAAGLSEIYGALSGDVETGELAGNMLSSASTFSGVATVAATGNVTDGAYASSMEGLLLGGKTGTGTNSDLASAAWNGYNGMTSNAFSGGSCGN